MKKILLTSFAMLLSLAMHAQKQAPEDVTVIEEQPKGTLVIYSRDGYAVREVKAENGTEENPYEIIVEKQTGTINIVYGENNKVYLLHPISNLNAYDGWIEGTVSEDGKTITVPMMQYIGYSQSFEMGVQIAMFKYDSDINSYVYDESVKEITYTINDDGKITMNGTSKNLILGAMNRTFGSTFAYLDYEWVQEGDYASKYTLFDEKLIDVPENLETEQFYMTTCEFNGAEWKPVNIKGNLGFDGDDAYLQGLFSYMPNAWVKGSRNGNTVTFPTKQFMGTYVMPIYFKGATIGNGNADETDVVFTFDGNDTYTTTNYIYITTDKEKFEYVTNYMGLTLSKHADEVINYNPASTENYVFSYRSNIGEEGAMENGANMVSVAFDGNDVYIQGLWEGIPEAWVAAHIDGEKLTFDLPQYLGIYKDEYLGDYPMYLTAFSTSTGELKSSVSFDYDAENKTFSNHNYPLSIGINKTGYLGIQDFYNGMFLTEALSVENIETAASRIESIYDAQGQRLNGMKHGINIVKMSDGTVRKIMK